MRQDIYRSQDAHFIKENEINVIDQWGNSNCIQYLVISSLMPVVW